MYPYLEAGSPLRVSARCTVVHRGGIVLSVAIYIKSKDLYTNLCGGCAPLTHNRVSYAVRLCDTRAHPIEPQSIYTSMAKRIAPCA